MEGRGAAGAALSGRFSSTLASVAAAVVISAGVTPVVATLITALTYIHLGHASVLGWPEADNLLAALVNGLGAWLLLSVPCVFLGLGQACRVNRASFEQLQARLTEVREWSSVGAASPPLGCDNAAGPCCRVAAACALGKHAEAVGGGLRGAGVAWVLGTEYIVQWRRLNAARALLPYVEPLDQVQMRAERLSSRIAESSLPGAAALEARLEAARQALAPRGRQVGKLVRLPWQTGGLGNGRPAHRESLCEGGARAAVAQVQHTVDDFRTDRYAGLVQARNLLLGTSGMTGVALYALLWLAIAASQRRDEIAWGLAFYLVGAIVGLFNLLYLQAGIECSVEDYSLSTARVVVAPQLAGVAALLGVALAAMTGVAQGSPGEDAVGHFTKAVNFLPAAGFALSPGVVLAGLRKKTEDYKQDLKSSRATGHRAS